MHIPVLEEGFTAQASLSGRDLSKGLVSFAMEK
jgi:hypothetical protein